MVVPRSGSGGSASSSGSSSGGSSIEISIRARDQASAIVGQIQTGFDAIATSATVAQVKITAMSAAIASLASASLKQLAQVSQVFMGLKTALDTPVTRTVFDQIKQSAQDSLAETQSLSSVLSNLAAVGGVAGQGFLGVTKTSVIDDIDKRFEKVSAKITGRLAEGFTNLPIDRIPFASKLIPPGFLERSIGPLDQTLSTVLLDRLIGRKVPAALGGVFKQVFGQDLSTSIAGTIKNSPLVNLIGEPAKELLGGSLLGAIESKVSKTLTSAFKLGFVNADSFITAGATVLGKSVGTSILSQATEATAANFTLFDRLVGGNASKFINTQLPQLSKQAVEKSGAVQVVRGLTGELTNLISGSIVTGVTGGLVQGGIGQALFQLLGDDLAAKGIKNLTGGVLVKLGEKVADITQLTTLARVGFEGLFNSIATGVVQDVGAELTTSLLGVLNKLIPAPVQQLFGFIQRYFPTQVTALRESVINSVGDFVSDAITNFSTSKVDRLKARVNELNQFIASKGGAPSTTTSAPIDNNLRKQLDLAAQADAARSRVAALRQEIADLQNAPIKVREELVRVQLDTTLDPTEKAKLISDLTAQLQAAEQALESPAQVLEARLRELETIIAAAPKTAPQTSAPVPKALQQELNLALDAEDAKNQIAGLEAELDSLNQTPLRLQEDLAKLTLDPTLAPEVVAQLKDNIEAELAATEAAIAPRVAQINQEISRLGQVVAASPRSVAEVFEEIQNLRLQIPVDTQEVTEARTKIAGLEDELAQLENQPALLKEELVRVQLDTEIPAEEKRQLVENLTRDIRAAEAVLQNPIAKIQSEIASLNEVIASTPKVAALSAQPGEPIELVDAPEVEQARSAITALNAEVAKFQAQPDILKEERVRVELDTSVPDDERQALVDNLTSQIEAAETVLQNPIGRIRQEITDLNNVISNASNNPTVVVQVDSSQVGAAETQVSNLDDAIANPDSVVIDVDASAVTDAQTDLADLDTTVEPVTIDVDASAVTEAQTDLAGLDAEDQLITIEVDATQVESAQTDLAGLDTTVEPVTINVDASAVAQTLLTTEELAAKLADLEQQSVEPQGTQNLSSRLLDLVVAAEAAKDEIVNLETEVELLNETPVTLQNEIASINQELATLGNGNVQAEALTQRREELTAELAATQAAIAPRIAEIQNEIAKLNGAIAQAPAATVDEFFNAQVNTTVVVDDSQVQQASADVDAIAQTDPTVTINVDASQVQQVQPITAPDATGLVEQFEAAEKAREEIIRVRQELQALQAPSLALKDELVRVTLDTEIPDDAKQELVDNLTRDIREAELALREPIAQIQAEIESLNETIARSPATVDDLLASRQPKPTPATPTPEPALSDAELESATQAYIQGQQAREQIAGLRQELQRLANTPSALKQQRDDILIFNKVDFRDKLSQLGEFDKKLKEARSRQTEIKAQPELSEKDKQSALQGIESEIKRIEQEKRRIDVVLSPDLKPEEKQKLVSQLTTQIKDAEKLIQSPVVKVQAKLITTQEQLQAIPIDDKATDKQRDSEALLRSADRAQQLKTEIANLGKQLADFESQPIQIKEQLVRLELDTSIPPEKKGKLAANLKLELDAAEQALANPIAQIQQQIIDLNQVVASAPRTLPTAAPGVQAQSVEDFEAIEAARTEVAALEAEIAALNANPIRLRADLERVKLDTSISDADKSTLIANLTKQISDAEAAIQSPLQRLALQITGIIGNASSESGGTLIIDIERIFNQLDGFLEGTLSDSFTEIGRNAARGFTLGLGDSIFKELAPIIDRVDGLILGTINKLKALPGRFAEPLGKISTAFTFVGGINEPVELFQTIQEKAGAAFGAIAKVGEQITFFQSGFQTLQSLVTNGPFELLIGQNIKLNEQLLSTKASLVSTNKVIDQMSGKTITDPTKAIQTLDAPVNAAVDRIRKGSLELTGVTSSQLISSFQIIAQQAGGIGLSLEQSADTTLSFAAALGTLGVPLDAARQEVTSILTAQITSDSVVAKSLGITNEQVRLYKSQGKVFEFLQEKLSAFRAGNKLASESIGGYASNIQEIFETIALNAGKPLLAPITQELKGIYDYLNANQDAIAKAVGEIALNLFTGIKAVFDAIKVVGKAFESVLTKIPAYLFGSLSNTLTVVGQSATNAVQALLPMIDVFSKLFEFVRPLGGPLLQIAIQAKALQIGISTLGNSFGFLSNLLPGVGELLFGVTARTLPMVNLFPALAGGLGTGAAGFLLLGQNMNSIPGVASQVVAKLGLFGPLAPIIAGVIPSVAGIGITIAGLAKNFPPLQAGLNKLFAANPADLISGLKAFTGLVPGLGFLNPLLDQASGKVRVLAANQSLSAFATTQFNIALKAAGIQLRNFLVSTALLGAGLFLAFQAVDKFIIKNEALLDALQGISEGIQLALAGLAAFATNPFFTGISVTIGVAVIAANGLHVALLRLIATQLAGWATGVAGALSQVSSFLKLIRLGSLAAGAAQASVGLQGVAIALTQGSAASAQFLASQGINVVTLNSLQTSLTSATVKVKLFATGLLETAANAFKSFVAGLGAVIGQIKTLVNAAASGGVGGVVSAIQAEITARTTAIVVQKEAALAAAQTVVAEKQAAVATAELSLAQNNTAASSQALSTAQKELAVAQQSAATAELEVTAAKEAQAAASAKSITAEQAEAISIAEANVARTQAALSTAQHSAAQATGAVSAAQFALAEQQAALSVAELVLAEQNAAVTAAELAFAEQGSAVAAAQLTTAQQAAAVAATEVTVAQNAVTATSGRLAVAEQAAALASGELAVAQQAAAVASGELAVAQTATSVTGKGLGGLLATLAGGFTSVAASIGALVTSIGTAIAGFIAMAAPILVVVAAVAALGAIFYTSKLADSNEAVALYAERTDAAASAALVTAQKLKAARDSQAKATANGIRLTDDEYAANKKLIAQATERKKQIDEQIGALQAAKKDATGDENKRNIESQIAELERVKLTLNKLGDNIQLAPKELPRLGTAFEQLAEKAKSAGEAIKNSAGDPEIFKKKAGELIEITNAQVEQGQITAEAARERLNALASSETVDYETQLKAQKAITETYKQESQLQVDTKQAAEEKIQAAIASGNVKESEGEKQVTALKNQELQIQIDSAQAAHDKRVELLDEEFSKTQEFLQKQLAARQKEADTAKPQDKDAKLKAVQQAQAQIDEAEAAHNESLKKEEEKSGAERTKLQAQQEKNIAESAKRIQEARLREVEKATKRAADITQKAENDRLIQTQQLVNQGKITQAQAEESKVADSNASNKTQIESEQKKQAALEELIKAAPTAKAREELEIQLRESRLKTQDLTLKSLEGEQKAHEAHIATVKSAIEKAGTVEQIAIEKRINAGQATEAEAADLRADQKVKSLNAEVGLERVGSEKRLKLELELQQAIRAAREAENAKRKEELANQQTVEQIALEKRINAGQATEAEAADLTADQKVAQVQQELSLEGLTKTKRLQLELELQKSIRAARESEINKRKEELANQQTVEQIAIEKLINAGKATEAEAADLTADQKVSQLQQELSLETTNKTKRLQLELELQKSIRAAREAEINKRKAELEDEQNAVLIGLEKQLNAGQIEESAIARVRADQKVAQIQQELSLETTDKSKRLKLELDLQEAIKQARDAVIAERKEQLEQANLAEQNQIDAQNQALRQQGQIFDILTQAMENRNRLLQAGASLVKAQSDFAANEINILSQGEKSEFRKRQLAEITAAIKLEALLKEQAFQRESLKMELEKQRLAIANEKMQNRIQQGEQKASIAKARADLEIAKLDPKTSKPQLEALQIKLQAEVDKGAFLQAQTGLIDQKAAIGEKEIQIKQAQSQFEQRSALRGAQAELARALPPGQRNRAERAVRQLVSEDLGATDYQDLRNKGLARSRSVAAENLGNVVTTPVPFDSEQYDMARKLQGVQRTFGDAALTPAPGTIIPSGTQPLALPQVDLKGLGISFENSGQAFVSGIDKLINKLDTTLTGGGQNINVTLTTPTGTQNSTINTTQPAQAIDLAEVVKFSKQLVGI